MNRKHDDEHFTTLNTRQAEVLNTESADASSEVIRHKNPTVLFIEPFYGGSHRQLLDLLIKSTVSYTFVHLKARKWHWRARCSALMLSTLIPIITTETVLFCSSVLNLAELLGLRCDLHNLKKVVYFHENQLVYPIRFIKDRDIQFAYNQITTCLAADVVLFNSCFNKESFLNNIKNVIKIFPDYKPKDLKLQIEPKCKVLYFPVSFTEINFDCNNIAPLHIVWPHRWEFDKGPTPFLRVLFKLKENGMAFTVSLLGETFEDVPDIFNQAKDILGSRILQFGYVRDKEEYYKILSSSHVAVSTAVHEFFGVSMLEAVHCGCYPLVPNRLVYPEIYPANCLYENEEDLYERLKQFCLEPDAAVCQRRDMNIDLTKYSAEHLLPSYLKLFDE